MSDKDLIAFQKRVSKESPVDDCGFKCGDRVTFINDYNVSFENLTVIGFAEEVGSCGRFIHIDSCSWWFPVRPDQLVHDLKWKIQKVARLALDGGVEVSINSALPSLSVSCRSTGDSWFFQESEAEDILSDAIARSEELGVRVSDYIAYSSMSW